MKDVTRGARDDRPLPGWSPDDGGSPRIRQAPPNTGAVPNESPAPVDVPNQTLPERARRKPVEGWSPGKDGL